MYVSELVEHLQTYRPDATVKMMVTPHKNVSLIAVGFVADIDSVEIDTDDAGQTVYLMDGDN